VLSKFPNYIDLGNSFVLCDVCTAIELNDIKWNVCLAFLLKV